MDSNCWNSTNLKGLRALHLSTGRVGGAANAAVRIVSAQNIAGIDAFLKYRKPASLSDWLRRDQPTDLSMGIGQSVTSRAHSIINRRRTRQPSVLFTPTEVSLTDRQIRKLVAGFDVINVHNAYNFVKVDRLRKAIPRAKIVLTLHDERLLTSGCHYTLDCAGFLTSCRSCPQDRMKLRFGRQEDSPLKKLRDDELLRVVTPSSWLARQVEISGFPKDRLTIIPYPIDTQDFPLKTREPRGANETLTVGWLPGKLHGPFWEAIRLVNSYQGRTRGPLATVLTTTHASVPHGQHVIRVDPPTTESERADFWSRADVGVSLTPADNFPNVTLESICVGTPFISNQVGGAGEAISATQGGRVIPTANPEDLSEALLDVIRSPDVWNDRALDAAKRLRILFSPIRVGEAYKDLYWSFEGLDLHD